MVTVFSVLLFIFDLALMFIYLNTLLKPRKKSIPVPLFLAGFLGVETLLTIVSEFLIAQHTFAKVWILLSLSLITTFALTFFYNVPLRHRLFTTFSFQVICTFSELLADCLFVQFATKLNPPNTADSDYIISLFSKLIMLLLIIITTGVWNRKRNEYPFSYHLLLLLTPAISILILLFTPYPKNSTPAMEYMRLLSLSCLLVLNIVNYYLLGNSLQIISLKKQEEQLHQQLDFQTSKFQQISVAYRNSYRMLHDIKKHFFYIQECIDTGHYGNINSYIKTSINDLESCYCTLHTGNLVVDAFISNYQQVAAQENITFHTEIQIDAQRITVDDYDLCVILGNLLDNSMNACRQIPSLATKEILVDIFTTKTEFAIHIENTFAEDNVRKNSAGEYQFIHGYGMENIMNTVIKYEGNYTHEVTANRRYEAIVLLPLELQI